MLCGIGETSRRLHSGTLRTCSHQLLSWLCSIQTWTQPFLQTPRHSANGERKPVAYKSRALTPTEQRYAKIEKEALAFTWACESLSDYLLGLRFHIETDHKPLVPLFSPKKGLDELPLQLQRFRLRMMRYSFSISHVPGKSLTVADTLSRAPSAEPKPADKEFQKDTSSYISNILSHIPTTERRVAEIKQHQHQDEVCKQLIDFCLKTESQ